MQFILYQSLLNMSLQSLLQSGIKEGAFIDERIIFQNTESAGISAFVNSNTETPINIEIPNSLIIKPEDAYSGLNIDLNLESNLNSLTVFKFYIACLRKGLILNSIFKSYINNLPELNEIHSPLSFKKESFYVFENTDLKYSIIEKNLNLLKIEFSKISNKNNLILFNDFLWAHLIITSRAFPYKIINPNANSYDVMLLPIIDLFNHKTNSKVKWSSNSNGDFKLSILEIPNKNLNSNLNSNSKFEIFNNYGPKGNSELLIGYGFVIENNEFDTLQLSLSLNKELKRDILNNWNVKLSTIEDFTFNICNDNNDNNNNENLIDDSNEKTVFILNKFHPIPDNLIKLFCYINKNDQDKGITLKNMMNGLNRLKQSLELKYSNILDKMPSFNEDLIYLKDYENAKILRKGQLNIYNISKNEIKSREKKYLKDYRKNFITIKDLFKKDKEFQDLIKICSWDKPIDELNKLDLELILRLWMMKNINEMGNKYIEIDWFIELFNSRKSIDNLQQDEFMIDLYQQLIPSLINTVPDLIKGENWNLEDWLLIDKLIVENSYEKGKTQEPILIKPLDLI